MSAATLPPLVGGQSSVVELLLALADDEFVIGFANSEWTGIAPVLEGDIAFSSLAQDEIGHARVLYELLAELSGDKADVIVYGREPSGFRNAQLVERARGDWAYAVMRQWLYDTADQVRLEVLQKSTYQPLAFAASQIVREEKYHLMHAQTWMERLAEGSDEARQRQRAAFDALWPDALALWEPVQGEEELVASGVLVETFAAMQQRWLQRIEEPLRRYDLPWPFVECGETWEPLVAPRNGGRRGEHGEDFLALYEQMTSVYRIDPAAQW